MASFRAAWACCSRVQHTSVFIGDDREGPDPEVHTDPELVPVLRAAALVVQLGCDTGDGDNPAAALEAEAGRGHVEPPRPQHRGELAGVLANPGLAELGQPKGPWAGCPHGRGLAGLGLGPEPERRRARVPALEPGEPGRLPGPLTLTGLRPVRERGRRVDRRTLEHVCGHLASPGQSVDLVAILVQADVWHRRPAVFPGVHVVDERHLRPRQRRSEVSLGHPVRAFGDPLVQVGHGPSDAVVVRQPGGARMGQEPLVLGAVRV